MPVLTPRVSSYCVHWITPIPSRVSAPPVDGLRNEVVVRENLARELFPWIQPQGYDTAIRNESPLIVWVVALMYLGFAVLLPSVLLQRLKDRKSDRYTDVAR